MVLGQQCDQILQLPVLLGTIAVHEDKELHFQNEAPKYEIPLYL